MSVFSVKEGDKVVYRSPDGDGPDDGLTGTVQVVTGSRYSVLWSDGEEYTYQVGRPSSSVWKVPHTTEKGRESENGPTYSPITEKQRKRIAAQKEPSK